MWARIVEILMAIWLADSHSIFSYPPADSFFWISDLISATLIALFALASFAHRFEKMHLCSIPVALWLIGTGFFGSSAFPHPFFLQNHLILGLLLAILVIVPSDSHKSPKAWREFFKRRG